MSEKLIQKLEATGDYKVMRRLQPVDRYNEDDGSEKHIGIYLDVETTGLDSDTDKVIELAMIPFEYSDDGKIYRVLDDYTSYQDPCIPLPALTTEITGITNEMVAGHSIDMSCVKALLDDASIVIAHNAGFDRGFMENFYEGFKDIPWGCSLNDINWNDESTSNRSLEYLAYLYGFFYGAHRATIDCQAGIEILSQNLFKSGESVLKRLLDNAKIINYRLWAINSPFDRKDDLKQRGYRWSAGNNGEPKAWYIDIEQSDLDKELEFLCDEIKLQNVEQLPKKKINALTRYSKRV